MYGEYAWLYDKLYAAKDYAGEANVLRQVIAAYQRSGGRRLLDVACGTGKHLPYLRPDFDVEGLDLSPQLLRIARERLPDVAFHQADMGEFDLGQRFDVITCLFSAIGYAVTPERLRQALGAMARHLAPGGVLVVEPWFVPEQWIEGHVSSELIQEKDLAIARVSTSFLRGRVSIFDMHFLTGTPQGTEYFVEHHEMGLFETEEQLEILRGLGLETTYDPIGLTGRGLFIAVKPLE